MTVLVNAYCSVVAMPEIKFTCKVIGQRDYLDPELSEHLQGFAGYVASQGGKEMTQAKYYTIKHIQRVKNHISIEIEDEMFDQFAKWATEANAIVFLPDGTVRNPNGVQIIPESAKGAMPPYPISAIQRKNATEEKLSKVGVRTPKSLPPVLGDEEIQMRSPREVCDRIMGCFTAAVYAEGIASNRPIAVGELKDKLPIGYKALTPNEKQFVEKIKPDKQAVVDHAWKYECVKVLLWCIGLDSGLGLPVKICDVSALAKRLLSKTAGDELRTAKFINRGLILDELDLIFRLQWAAHDARVKKAKLPGGLDPGIIHERMYALNWITKFYDSEWDDIDTPA
jgi:hypothetical protein